ncbi:hypothetical transcript [Echinococcus multilocularis]|uniref:Hypothetical transcript n=1 Tax=Echinococcus multilocularis TaxID=6211 RepID=A0A0S4MLW0_ECHMU|nr:hypothetical transcript [Echinococcus multilocularis]
MNVNHWSHRVMDFFVDFFVKCKLVLYSFQETCTAKIPLQQKEWTNPLMNVLLLFNVSTPTTFASLLILT